MREAVLMLVATSVSQALGAALLAALLFHFHRRYGKAYLFHWALSWCCHAGYLASTAAAIPLTTTTPASDPLRLTLGVAGSLLLYLQVTWLVQGAWELARGRGAGRRFFLWLLPVVAGAALVTTFAYAYDPGAAAQRYLLRLGFRSALAGAAFLAAAVLVWRARPGEIRSGPRLVAVAFFLFALQHLHYLGVAVLGIFRVAVPYGPYLGFVDFLLQWVMGVGMVACLLEDERAVALRAARQVQSLAFRDALTGLPNRQLFADRLRMALARAQREGTRAAVMFLDLDRFKLVNDSLGHSAGDELLRAVSRRLAESVREGDTVARVGGDEFNLLFPRIGRAEDAGRIARKLLEALRSPVEVGGRELRVTGSIGIALFPDDGLAGETLVQKADAAMYGAKEAGRDRLQYSSAAMIARAAEQLDLENQLRRAVSREEFTLHYQPILDARTGYVCGTEALVRWRHPERGLLHPGDFIRLAEQTGLTHRIGVWVLHEACAQTARWHRSGAEGLTVAVNLSADHFKDPQLVDEVTHALEMAGLEPRFLELEITETLAMENAQAGMHTLHALKALGVRLCLDDFGTGYSSLSYLKRFPLDALKVDRSLVMDVHRDRGDEAIVAAVVTLGRSLGMQVVAEGVENEAQFERVREHGCDLVQGFLFGRPAPPEELSPVLAERRARKVS